MNIADALVSKKYTDGEMIIRQVSTRGEIAEHSLKHIIAECIQRSACEASFQLYQPLQGVFLTVT